MTGGPAEVASRPVAPSLTELANRHGSDNGTLGPSPEWPAHGYTDAYEGYLAHLRDAPITLLEIGLGVDGPHWQARIQRGRNAGGGASIKMWRDYFPRASILGFDINPAGHLDGERVRTAVADQGSAESLVGALSAAGVERLDVIVDDGSHNPDHQQLSLGVLFPYLAPGGLYFIEDLQSNGLGDPSRRRSASRSVLNTRRVLSEYRATGRLPTPHAIADPDYFMEHAESLTFHCPEARLRYRLRPRNLRHPLAVLRSFAVGTEQLCLIRKRGRLGVVDSP